MCLSAWTAAWLGMAYVAYGWQLVPPPGSPKDWTVLLIGLFGGMAALVALPALPWWAGLGLCAWLLRDPRPTARMLGVWWLVLSIATPFYHPYARLWLPLLAV